MYQLQFDLPEGAAPLKAVPVKKGNGVITHIALKSSEVEYIELALLSVELRIANSTELDVFIYDSTDRIYAKLDYLKHWLNNPEFKSKMQCFDQNSVVWPFASSELVDWLLEVCQHRISDGALDYQAAMGADSMCIRYPDDDIDSANDPWHHAFSLCREGYAAIRALHQSALKDKINYIKSQGYPLFPKLSVVN
ncbi:MAG: hypothetical protein K2Q14_04640 [Gammaproteobacteria bacterium]|nr:hypothetical protein [Gammaproteobacteria bacterium]MBY0544819.1 hypothetical protein [Gammaproteobacteria bacterium]